jgi:multidrug efflux pump subunit AcrB
MQQAMADLRAKWNAIPGVSVSLQDLSIQGFTAQRGFPVTFNVRGPDWGKLVEQAQQIIAKMKESDIFRDVDTDYQVGMPELQIHPDRDRAAAMGVSMEAIAETVNALVGGVRAGQFKDKGRNYDVRVRLVSGQRDVPEDVSRLKVRARDGTLVPLGTLVATETKPTLLAVTRRGRERAITINANVTRGRSDSEALDRARAIGAEVLERGYTMNFSGAAQVMQDAGRELLFALLLGVAVAYMILAAQFNSFAHPVSVLAAMPLSLTGALAALWICDLSLNMYSAIGVLLLMGIVKKNSILLVEFTNHRRILGDSRDAALMFACPARLRPILMTTISTIVGAIPAAVAVGPGAELRQPMAVAVIGGLVLSTLLTLFVVPALYSVLDSVTSRIGSAARIERETLAVLADLQAEEVERYRHKKGGTSHAAEAAAEPEPAPAPAPAE